MKKLRLLGNKVWILICVIMLFAIACQPDRKKPTKQSTKQKTLKGESTSGKIMTGDGIFNLAKQSFVVVKNDLGDGQLGQGSGFFIEDGIILTNYHVVEHAQRITISQCENARREIEAEIIATDKIQDMALLKVHKYGRNATVSIAKVDSKNGEDAYAIGNPLGLDCTISKGLVNSIRTTDDGRSFMQISIPITHGNSGGPIYNNKGQVIGMATMGYDDNNADLNFAIPSKILTNFIKKNEENF